MKKNICPQCKGEVIKSGLEQKRLCLACGYERTAHSYYADSRRMTDIEFVESRAKIAQSKEDKYWNEL